MGNFSLCLPMSVEFNRAFWLYSLLIAIFLSPLLVSASSLRIIESGGLYYELTDGVVAAAQHTYTGTAKIVCPENNPNLTYNIATAIIPESITDSHGAKYLVTTVGEAAFYNCTSLKNVSIPANVTQIEYNAFLYCSGIETFRIERASQPLNIGKQIFDGQRLDKHHNYAPTSFYIGRPLKVSGDVSLLCQTNAHTCEIEGVNELTKEYVNGCESLKELILHPGLESIDNISGCTDLTLLEVPEGVTRIGSHTSTTAPDGGLQRLNTLTSIRLPSTLKEVSSFVDSEQLANIYLYAVEPPNYIADPLSKNPFPDSGIAPAATGTLHVPQGCLQRYKQTDNWHDSRYTIVADLQPITPDNRIAISLTSSGPGALTIISVDGQHFPPQDYEIDIQGSKVLLPSYINTISVAAIPDAGAEPQSIYASDASGNTLPVVAGSYMGATNITATVTDGMTISATFHELITSTLHLYLPSGTDNKTIGYPTLNIPYGATYRLHYTTTPGYTLSAVYLDDTELKPQIVPTPYTEDLTDKVSHYIIDIPPFNGSRILHLIEKDNGLLNVMPSSFSSNSQDTKLTYFNGKACLTGLAAGTQISIYSPEGQLVYTTLISALISQPQTYPLPSALKGLHIIQAGTQTFKVIL